MVVVEIHTPNSRAVTSTGLQAALLEAPARLEPDWEAPILRANMATRTGSRPAKLPVTRTLVPEAYPEPVPEGKLRATMSTAPRLAPAALRVNSP